MELQVFVNGKPRDVCGVDNSTTSEEVVNVLCQSLHLVGSYCLVAYWQKNEIVLAHSESPLKIIRRFGDHPKHFQFVLRRTDVRQPVNPTRTRSPVPTSHHHRRVSSNAGHYATFQNAATAYSINNSPYITPFVDQPKGHNYRRPEDKEVAAAFADRNSEQEAAELQKHSNVDWSKCYEEANQRYLALIDSRRSLQLKLRDLDANLRQSRGNVQELESEMAGALTKLLNLVEEALEVRRKTVSELSLNPETTLPPPPLPPTQANSTKAPACDEVLI